MKRTSIFSVFTIVLLGFLAGCSVPGGERHAAASRGVNDIIEDILDKLDLETIPPADKNEHWQCKGTLWGDLSGRYFVIYHRNSGKYLINYYDTLRLKYWSDVDDPMQAIWRFSRSRKYRMDNGYSYDYYKIVSYYGGNITSYIPSSTLKLDGTGGTPICWWVQDREKDGTYLIRSLKDVDYRIKSRSPYNGVELSENSSSDKLFLITQQDMRTFGGSGGTYIPVTVRQ